jgi:hypothetical protein
MLFFAWCVYLDGIENINILKYQYPTDIKKIKILWRMVYLEWVEADIPWSWDKQYRQPDVYGESWPRSVQLYKQQA